MGTRKHHKSKKSNKRFRKTHSKRGGSGKRKAESNEEEPRNKKLKRTDYICPSETYKFNEMSKLWCKDKRASLDLHPDKNRDCKDEATAKFQEFNNKCNKVDVNAKDENGETALMKAVKDKNGWKVREASRGASATRAAVAVQAAQVVAAQVVAAQVVAARDAVAVAPAVAPAEGVAKDGLETVDVRRAVAAQVVAAQVVVTVAADPADLEKID